MITMAEPTQLWNTMPGWGIVADLTPPQLINARQLKLLHRWLAGSLVALLVICAGGYFLAVRQHSSATHALDQVQARTRQLQAETRKYAGVTQIQGTVTQVQAQIAHLMSGDVDLVKLMGLIRSSLPATMTIAQETVTISLAAVASTGGSGSPLDTSGLPRIGSIAISGGAQALDNLSTYVDKLKVLVGVVDVVPTTNTVGGGAGQYTISLGLTSALISHRFDVPTTGGK